MVDYDPLPAVDRPRGGAVGPGAGPPRPGHQHLLHLGAGDRRRGRRPGLRRRRLHRQGALHPAAADRHGHGAPGLRGGAPALRRRPDPLQRHPDPPHPQDHGGAHPGHPRAAAPGGGAGGGRRLRLQARRLRRGAAVRGPGPASTACRCAGSRSAPRTPRPPCRAGARSRTSSWPPTPTAASPRCGSSSSATWAATSSSSPRASRCSGAFLYAGVYDLPEAYSFRCTGVFTTMTPTDAYRGAGRPEATYAIERAMDRLSAVSGIDPVELRRRNFVRADQYPYTAMTGLVYDSGDHEAAAGHGPGAGRLRRPAGRTAAPARRRRQGAPGHRCLVVLRDVRAGAVAGAGLAQLHGRRLGVGHRAGDAHQQGAGHHRGDPPRAGPRDLAGR